MPESERKADRPLPHRRAQDRNFITRFMAAHGAWVALVAAILTGSGFGAAFASRWAFLNEAPAAISELHEEMAALRVLLQAEGELASRVELMEGRVQALERFVVANQTRNAEQDRILQELLEHQTETLCVLGSINGEYPEEECLRQSTTQRLEALRERLRQQGAPSPE